jgi:hypothetical protein
MSHSYHPRTNSDDEPVYFDGCEECAHHSHDPVAYLDPERMATMWAEMVGVEYGNEHYRSSNDARAGKILAQHAYFMLRFTPINPWVPLEELGRWKPSSVS